MKTPLVFLKILKNNIHKEVGATKTLHQWMTLMLGDVNLRTVTGSQLSLRKDATSEQP